MRNTCRSLAILLPALAWMVGCFATRAKGQVVSIAPQDVDKESVQRFLKPRRVAWLVGIDRFVDPSWPPLRYPGKDVEDLQQTLQQAGPLRFTHVTRSISPDDVTYSALRETMKRVGGQIRSEQDTLLVYFSTHGTLERDEQNVLRQYLVLRDTKSRRVRQSGLAFRDLFTWFERLPSKRKVLILAACHSGYGKSRLNVDLAEELTRIKGPFFAPPLETHSEASFVLSASSWGETAREDDALANDVYTHFLVEGMLKHDLNRDGAVSISEAHDYARQMTFAYTRGTQRPTLRSKIAGTDPILLTGSPRQAGRPIVYSYAPRLAGLSVFSGREKVGILPGQLPLKAGRQELIIAHNPSKPLFKVNYSFAENERVLLESLLPAGPAHRIAGGGGWGSFLSDRARRTVFESASEARLHYDFHPGYQRVWFLRATATMTAGQQTLVAGHQPWDTKVLSILGQVGGGGQVCRDTTCLRVVGLLGAERLTRRFQRLAHEDELVSLIASVQLEVAWNVRTWLTLVPQLGLHGAVLNVDSKRILAPRLGAGVAVEVVF